MVLDGAEAGGAPSSSSDFRKSCTLRVSEVKIGSRHVLLSRLALLRHRDGLQEDESRQRQIKLRNVDLQQPGVQERGHIHFEPATIM